MSCDFDDRSCVENAGGGGLMRGLGLRVMRLLRVFNVNNAVKNFCEIYFVVGIEIRQCKFPGK